MKEVKFKVGDLVYYAECKKICKVVGVFCKNIVLDIGKIRVCIPRMSFFGMPAPIFHATQENYELLSKLYPNVTFEPPPKRKEPKEIIQSMLDDGWDCVPVIYLENGTKCMGYAKYSYLTMTATPFDPKTGKTIIDFVDGEVVLEGENE